MSTIRTVDVLSRNLGIPSCNEKECPKRHFCLRYHLIPDSNEMVLKIPDVKNCEVFYPRSGIILDRIAIANKRYRDTVAEMEKVKGDSKLAQLLRTPSFYYRVHPIVVEAVNKSRGGIIYKLLDEEVKSLFINLHGIGTLNTTLKCWYELMGFQFTNRKGQVV